MEGKPRAQDVRVWPDLEALSRELGATIARAVQAASGGPFWMALTGGRTSARLYQLLGTEYPANHWSNVNYFWSDERLVEPGSPDSNYRSAWESWLEPAQVPLERVHAPDVSIADAADVARRYERDVRQLLGPSLAFDCVLLSLGEDGHVASLFPGRREVQEEIRLVVPVLDSPKPPSRRVTMTLPLINRAAVIHVLAVGKGKAGALRRALYGNIDATSSVPVPPAAALRPRSGRVVWWVDNEAVRLQPGRHGRRTSTATPAP